MNEFRQGLKEAGFVEDQNVKIDALHRAGAGSVQGFLAIGRRAIPLDSERFRSVPRT